jgi:hypothetical protein
MRIRIYNIGCVAQYLLGVQIGYLYYTGINLDPTGAESELES